jgi:signal transduction histidine kinase
MDGTLAFAEGEVREVGNGSGGETFLVYDRQAGAAGGRTLWVRGVGIDSGADEAINHIIRLTILLTPIFLLIGTLGGYLIIRQAFRAIDRIRRTADEIRRGDDLTKRIELPPGNDEVHRLAHTFDDMFDRLEDSFESERRFTSDASHELTTPTSDILAQCENALGENRKKPELLSSFEVVKRQAERMSGLIASLLQLTRMDRNAVKPDAEDFDMGELTSMATDEVGGSCAGRLDIRTDIESGVMVRGDRSLILRLILNLLNNACQYTPDGGTVTVSLRGEGDTAMLRVKDTGIGIAPEDIEHIWDRFYMASKSRTSEVTEGHTGLGLSMVKQIAEMHGGEVGVVSAVGEGSEFFFSIPRI